MLDKILKKDVLHFMGVFCWVLVDLWMYLILIYCKYMKKFEANCEEMRLELI